MVYFSRVILIFFISTWLIFSASGEDSLKKIVITKTNNDASYLFKNEFVFKTNSLSYLTEFYSFILKHGFEVKKNDEFSDIKYSLAWVTSQWKHDGMNEPTQGASGLDILKSVYQDKKAISLCRIWNSFIGRIAVDWLDYENCSIKIKKRFLWRLWSGPCGHGSLE